MRALHYAVFFHKLAGIKFNCPKAMLAGTIHDLICFGGRKKEKRFDFAMWTFNRLPGSFTWESDMPSAMLAIAFRFVAHFFLSASGLQ
jgi:hypothetical protein